MQSTIESLRAIQSRIDDILEAYRARRWPEVWRLFRQLTTDTEAAKQAAYREETGR